MKKRIILVVLIFCISARVVLSQSQTSKDNYTGAWESPTSWEPIWTAPQTIDIAGMDIIINGYITVNSSLTFSGSLTNLIINDTLVIKGDLLLDNYNNLIVNGNGILIVNGNFNFHNHAQIITNNYIVITGNINHGQTNGSFISNSNPAKVFVGGTILPGGITDNNYPALNCTPPITNPYPHSNCRYGDMIDLINDPIYPFVQSICIIATPTITSGGPTAFCAGGSVTLTSSAGASYLWSTGAKTQSINTTMPGSYAVIVTSAGGCQSAASVATIVTVNALPVTPTITAGGPTTFCADTSVTLTSSEETSFLWSNAATTPSINVTTPGSYTVQVTDASGCKSAVSAATVVTVNALPATPVITADGPTAFCNGGSVTLTSSTGTGYLWSTGATTESLNVTTAGSYTVRVKNVNGCISAASTATIVTVNALPAIPTITADGPTSFCAGGGVTLTSSAGTSYLWSTGATTQGINAATTGSYKVRLTDVNGCQSAASAVTEVKVNPFPSVSITSSGSLCLNDQLTLAGNPNGGTFIVISGPGNIYGNVLTAMGVGNINIEYSYTDICTNTAIQSIIVNERVAANAGPDQELKFVFETQMNAESSSLIKGEWTLISGSGQILNKDSPTSRVTGLSVGDNIFLWAVRNGSCVESDEVKITVEDLFVPSVITPNGDGKNDYFQINALIGNVELIIFNRWGNLEYKNSNYLNNWNGLNKKGTELPEDAYFYIIKFENGITRKGTVLITR